MHASTVAALLALSLPLASAHPISPYLDTRAVPRLFAPAPAKRQAVVNPPASTGGSGGGTINVGIGALAIGGGDVNGLGLGSIANILAGLESGEVAPEDLTDDELAAMEGLGDAAATMREAGANGGGDEGAVEGLPRSFLSSPLLIAQETDPTCLRCSSRRRQRGCVPGFSSRVPTGADSLLGLTLRSRGCGV